MSDVRISARKALGKGASLRRSSPLAHGLRRTGWRPTDVCMWVSWNYPWISGLGPNGGLLSTKDVGGGPIRHLRLLADRLGWVPMPGGWQLAGQKLKGDSAKTLPADH
eukprot:1858619-Amphidinium_carterae.4